MQNPPQLKDYRQFLNKNRYKLDLYYPKSFILFYIIKCAKDKRLCGEIDNIFDRNKIDINNDGIEIKLNYRYTQIDFKIEFKHTWDNNNIDYKVYISESTSSELKKNNKKNGKMCIWDYNKKQRNCTVDCKYDYEGYYNCIIEAINECVNQCLDSSEDCAQKLRLSKGGYNNSYINTLKSNSKSKLQNYDPETLAKILNKCLYELNLDINPIKEEGISKGISIKIANIYDSPKYQVGRKFNDNYIKKKNQNTYIYDVTFVHNKENNSFYISDVERNMKYIKLGKDRYSGYKRLNLETNNSKQIVEKLLNKYEERIINSMLACIPLSGGSKKNKKSKDLNNYTVSELKEICKKNNIKGYSKLKKSEVVSLIKKNKKK